MIHSQQVKQQVKNTYSYPQLEEGILAVLKKSKEPVTMGELKIALYKHFTGNNKLQTEDDLSRVNFITYNTSIMVVRMADMGRIDVTSKRKIKLAK